MHHIDAGVDTGNVIVRRPLPIHENATGHLLHAKMAYLVRATAAEIIRDFKAGKPIPEGQQQSGLATTHSSRDPRVNHIAWSDPRERIRNVVRALAPPLPAAFALVAGTPLYIARVDPVGAVTASGEKAPGMVEIGPGGTPIVWAGDGALRLTSVLADGRSVSAETLVESGHIAEGQVFD